MTNLNEKICAYCGNVFIPQYMQDGYRYIRDDVRCCSKSCATQLLRSISKEDLEEKALDFIRTRNEYCTLTELCKGIGHSCKTFTKHGLKLTELNKEVGFTKPKSKFQETVGDVLNCVFPTVETEKQFDGLVGNTGHLLRVDFYIPCINTVVEADGNQHHNPKHPWQKWNNGTVAEYDEIKDRFFKEKGVELVRIPYKRNLTETEILSHLS